MSSTYLKHEALGGRGAGPTGGKSQTTIKDIKTTIPPSHEFTPGGKRYINKISLRFYDQMASCVIMLDIEIKAGVKSQAGVRVSVRE